MRAKKALAMGKGRVSWKSACLGRRGVGGCDVARGGRVRKGAQLKGDRAAARKKIIFPKYKNRKATSRLQTRRL